MINRKIINRCIVYKDNDDKYHRLDGPAINWLPTSMWPGTKFWAIHGNFICCNIPNHIDVFGNIVMYVATNKEFLSLMKMKVFW